MMEFANFDAMISRAKQEMWAWGQTVDSGRWQGVPTVGKPDLVTQELLDWRANVPVYRERIRDDWSYLDQMAMEIEPNREWADEHFEERVGGEPLNPDPSHERWPHWHGQDAETKAGGKFTHTYSERFWPRYAGEGDAGPYRTYEGRDNHGIRFAYGDYDDVLNLLFHEPFGRQAYLPIFFPEDTGAAHGGRIPCTLGYHLLRRNNYLHLWYDIRSCDLYRHFRDDVYLAVRLMLHTLDRLGARDHQWLDVKPGTLYFCAHSLHIHKGDWHHVYP